MNSQESAGEEFDGSPAEKDAGDGESDDEAHHIVG